MKSLDMNSLVPRVRSRCPLVFAVAIVVLLGAVTAGGVSRAVRPLPALRVEPITTQAAAGSVGLPWTASGESAIATADGTILGQGANADRVVPTASIAKLITILTVFKKHPLKPGETGPLVTMTQRDVALFEDYAGKDGSTAAVFDGEAISEFKMIEAMLLPSANNMADSLAIWAYGSLGAYRTAAQATVRELGMNNTTIGSDASGFSPDTTSTANDLVKLGRAATTQDVIKGITTQYSAEIPVAGTVYTTNEALGEQGITGLKTGTSDQAGNCFLFSADHTFGNGQQESFVGVVIDAPSSQARFSDATTLLGAVYANYKEIAAIRKDAPVARVTSAWGAQTTLVATRSAKEYTWLGRPAAGADRIDIGDARTLAKGQAVGAVVNGSDSVPLVTSGALGGPSLWWRLTR